MGGALHSLVVLLSVFNTGANISTDPGDKYIGSITAMIQS